MFAAIAGRLHRIEYYLNELGENAAAMKVQGLIDSHTIDVYISDFSRFARNFNNTGLPDPAFFLKGLEFVSRLKKIFQAELLTDIIDKYYLRLCQRLINSYLSTVGGNIFKSPPPFNLVHLTKDMVEYVNNQKHVSSSIPAGIEDETCFTRTLIQRLSHKPLVAFTPEIIIINNLGLVEPAINADREAIEDILYSIFEFYARKKTSLIKIKIHLDKNLIKLSIIPGDHIKFPIETIDFYNMLMDDTGSYLSFEDNDIVFNFMNAIEG
ncbi:hypothetical protein [Candidatus Contubernalis alkaliaceticus]|uniref:hypothetical protein n=1 Tax=Candidatus Contubernalis alkaliaceticus TaxID=338645 RepID=UPI001F4BCF96|nr:hypothetical protein [Candidatus Contubernalis alkalaceticus]UNC92214.1 hypothetical protein HUE98_09000 [Candidatus Contubernalis alkalaceticus]